MQLPPLVPPVDLELHPGQVPIGEHVDETILPLRGIADLGSILIRGETAIWKSVRTLARVGVPLPVMLFFPAEMTLVVEDKAGWMGRLEEVKTMDSTGVQTATVLPS